MAQSDIQQTAPTIAMPGVSLDIVSARGLPDVATVYTARLRGGDRDLVEFVDGLDPPVPRAEKWIINVSTQIGCPVRCPYCDAGGDYRGDLSSEEILAQVSHVAALHPAEVGRSQKVKVHFSRMGEPALNDAVLAALTQLPKVLPAPGLWACVATTAPHRREAWFERLRGIKAGLFRGRFQLQFSLNTTDPEVRQRLTPHPHWSFEEIACYGERFVEADDRKIVLNFALARDVPFDIDVLAAQFDPSLFAVKLTPLNPTLRGAANKFQTLLRSERAPELARAVEALRDAGYDTVVSVGDPREDAVGSNCGQSVRMLEAGLDQAPPPLLS